MKITGIIAEYNPFHNGHKFQIENTDADATVVVMSGNFVQRGAPAIWNKWKRAEYAVKNGADLVLELPCDFDVASAERFAYGGVFILNSLNLIDTITFGAENNLSELQRTLNELSKASIPDLMSESDGLSYHEARNLAVSDKTLLNKPNNILGIEYLKALKKLNSKILPTPILRTGVMHNDLTPDGNFASASFIRQEIVSKRDVKNYIPYSVPNTKHITADDFYELICYKILSQNLSDIGEVREGIENRILKGVACCNSFDELVLFAKSKRFTYTSVSRMLIQILLNLKKSELCDKPQYTRVLGANEKGREILAKARKSSEIPIITKGSDAKDIPEFNLDVRAGNIYSLIEKSPLNQDFLMMPYIE